MSQEEHPWGLDTTVNAVSHFHDPTLISVFKEVLGRGVANFIDRDREHTASRFWPGSFQDRQPWLPLKLQEDAEVYLQSASQGLSSGAIITIGPNGFVREKPWTWDPLSLLHVFTLPPAGLA